MLSWLLIKNLELGIAISFDANFFGKKNFAVLLSECDSSAESL